ncbi:energy transducer TonB [Paraglaciecola aquimarina]|uniref:Energy transducer TonB n=1 Tax=Paraglaciecola aquimarina TaxID=1235557 RepID=A0ABU3SUH7_9ALTE|nr:energy transducer TonB [Paraglaciecola aquimarina]MDU0353670.1 energy transducer TonB [Paraglaciecola aquimarina]
MVFLANEYEHPHSMQFAGEIYQSLNQEQQSEAAVLAEELAKEYGKTALAKQYYPYISDQVIESQDFDTPAKMLKRGKLIVSSDHLTRGRNQSAVHTAARNYGVGNGGALSALKDSIVNPESGRVEVIYSVRKDGQVENPEVIFSWPKTRFDKDFITAVINSKLKVAKRDGEKVAQHGLFQRINIFYEGVGNLEKGYPHIHKTLLSLKKRAHENPAIKYQYAMLSRAYGEVFDDTELEAFEPLLFSSAEQGYSPAMYDYGMFQLYHNDDIDKAIYWITKAAKNSYIEAEYRLGKILYHSPSAYLQEDPNKARFWLEKAASKNHAKAQQALVELNYNMDTFDSKFAQQSIDWLENMDNENFIDPNTYFLLAHAYKTVGQTSKAKRNIKDAIWYGEKNNWDVTEWIDYQKSI